MRKEHATCVYGIRNKVTDKWYVGSTTRRYYRWQDHLRMLKQNRHHAPKLQMSFNKHGEHAFEFIVLRSCKGTKNLSKWEQYWLNKKNSYWNGYNTLEEVRWTDPVVQAARVAKKWSNPEQRTKQAEMSRKMWLKPGFKEHHARQTSKAQKKRWDDFRNTNYTPEQWAAYNKRYNRNEGPGSMSRGD